MPGGGLGVFTEEALPRGTTLGAYPGRLLYMAEYSRKLAEHPRASSYCWKRQDGSVLDPTDQLGNIVEVVPLLEVGGELTDAWGAPTTLSSTLPSYHPYTLGGELWQAWGVPTTLSR